ncbi:MAG: hypothetical protein GF331_09370 [Chitinivibrionales bacterium]|nr:hypothetical protein [Chitinivibrionales bacterium]
MRTHKEAAWLLQTLGFTMLLGCASSKPPGGYPEVAFGEGGLVKGPRTVANVKVNMERFLPRLYYLYAEARGPDTSLHGTVFLRMEVNQEGQFAYVGVHSSTMRNEEFEDLLVAGLLEGSFDEWADSRDNTDIIYPIPFTPEHADSAPKSRRRRVFEEKRRREQEQREEPPPQKPSEDWNTYEEQ